MKFNNNLPRLSEEELARCADRTINRLREADEKLTGTLRWVLYESRGIGSDDHQSWNQEPARSTHAAPQKIAEEWKRAQRQSGWLTLLWIVAVLGACAVSIWAILHLK